MTPQDATPCTDTIAHETLWKWIVGLLIVAQFSLIGAIYISIDRRITAIEMRDQSDVELHRSIAVSLATLAANQNEVMRQLQQNALKLDDLLKIVYAGRGK